MVRSGASGVILRRADLLTDPAQAYAPLIDLFKERLVRRPVGDRAGH
jgi:hypothetical protein